MQILITESQFKILKEGIDILHYVRNLFSDENIKRFRTEGDDNINQKIQNMVDLIWKVMSKTKEYQSLKKIKKYLTRVFVHKSTLSGSGAAFATDKGGIKHIEWSVVIILDFKPYFKPTDDSEFHLEFVKFQELFDNVSEKMGVKKGGIVGITPDNGDTVPVKHEIKFHIYV